jgi:hypothetical protein
MGVIIALFVGGIVGIGIALIAVVCISEKGKNE